MKSEVRNGYRQRTRIDNLDECVGKYSCTVILIMKAMIYQNTFLNRARRDFYDSRIRILNEKTLKNTK